MNTDLFVGLDLGQSNDPSALVVLEQSEVKVGESITEHYTQNGTKWEEVDTETETQYAVRHATRWELGTEYPDIVKGVASLMTDIRAVGTAELLVDKTGVGRPIVDMMNKANLDPIGVTITGGDDVTGGRGKGFGVPKRDLATGLQVLMQSGRLKVAKDLPHLDALRKEMQKFSAKVSRDTGHVTYEHLREQDHDDLVLALAIACWYAERMAGRSRSVEGESLYL